MTEYADVVTAEFEKSFGRAWQKRMSNLDATKVLGHPLLADTLKAIDGKTEVVDDVAAALSARADQLAALAEANRETAEWIDICVAMGATRNAAAEVWRYADQPSVANPS